MKLHETGKLPAAVLYAISLATAAFALGGCVESIRCPSFQRAVDARHLDEPAAPDRCPSFQRAVDARRGPADAKEVRQLSDPSGDRTALMRAIDSGKTEAVKALLAAGADVNAKDQCGQTALMRAIDSGKTEAVKALLAAGADVNAKDQCGQTALMHAVYSGKTEAVKALLAAGADVNAKDQYGNTALMCAANAWYSSASKKTSRERRRLMCAANAWCSSTEILRLLIRKGADVNAKNKYGRTALLILIVREPKFSSGIIDEKHFRACTGKALQALLENGADVNAKIPADDKHPGNEFLRGLTPLMAAARYSGGAGQLVKLLLEKGAKIDDKDRNGQTALMHAVYSGKTEAVKALLAAGADVNAKDHSGNTALKHAIRLKNTRCANAGDEIPVLLKEAGAKE